MSSDLGLKVKGVFAEDEGEATDSSSEEDDGDEGGEGKLKIGFVQDDGTIITGVEHLQRGGGAKLTGKGAAARNARAAAKAISTWSADAANARNPNRGKKSKLLEKQATKLDAVLVAAEPRLTGLGHNGLDKKNIRRSREGSASADREYRRLMAGFAANLLCGALRARFFRSAEQTHRALLDPLQMLLARCACAASRRPAKDGSAVAASNIRAIRR
jgi:hypothetical protein